MATLTPTEIESRLESKLEASGLGQALRRDLCQFIDLPSGFFVEIVLEDGTLLPRARRVISELRRELEAADLQLDDVVRATWTVAGMDVESLGAARASDGGTRSAERFRARLVAGRGSCQVTVDVSTAAQEHLKELQGQADLSQDALKLVVRDFLELELSSGGKSYWDPLLFPELDLSTSAVSYLFKESFEYRELRTAINDFFDPAFVRDSMEALAKIEAKAEEFTDKVLSALTRQLRSVHGRNGTPVTTATQLYRSLSDRERDRIRWLYERKAKQAPQHIRDQFPGLF
jgi:hypothetical protein